MRVLHVSPSFYPALMYGGPVMALYQLCLSQLAAGLSVTVLTSDAAGAQRIYQLPTEQLPTQQLPAQQLPAQPRQPLPLSQLTDVYGVPTYYAPVWLRPDVAPGLLLPLARLVRKAQVVHVTGVFSATSLLGLLAAARKGWVEEAIMRLADFTFAFPALLLAIMLTAVFGAGIVNSIIAIGIFYIPTFARVTRASANAVWAREYILAARACGKGPWAITWQHVLPNISAVLIVQVTIRFAIAILAEAALSYLGLGTQPPQPSWGRMLNEAQTYMAIAPRLADGRFVLISQERLPVQETMWEFPAGQIDTETTCETIVATALNELREEAGLALDPAGGRLTPMGWYLPSQGFTDECVYLFHAEPVCVVSQPEPEGSEHISSVRFVSAGELRRMIAENEITNALSLALFARMAAKGLL